MIHGWMAVSCEITHDLKANQIKLNYALSVYIISNDYRRRYQIPNAYCNTDSRLSKIHWIQLRTCMIFITCWNFFQIKLCECGKQSATNFSFIRIYIHPKIIYTGAASASTKFMEIFFKFVNLKNWNFSVTVLWVFNKSIWVSLYFIDIQ